MVGDAAGGLISGDISSWNDFGQTLLISAGTSILSYGIANAVSNIYGGYQYSAIREYSQNNSKVNKMLGGLQGKQYKNLSKLKIGANTKDEFLKALAMTNSNSTINNLIGGTVSVLLGMWF